MAGYCSVDDVSSLGTNSGKPYSAETNPTLTSVQSFIDEKFNYINAKLFNVGIVTPVDETASPISYALLKFLNKLGAGYEAEGVTYRKATKLEVTRYDQLKKQFDEKLKELLDDPKILSDSINTGALILDPSQDNPYSRTGELYVDSELEEINPLFTMQDQF